MTISAKSLPLSYVDKLQHSNADDLAFYPLDSIAEAIARGRVIPCYENGEPAGYLWHGPIRHGRDVTIYQACIDYDARRQHLGFGIVRRLTDAARSGGATGVRLRCASSAASNQFWIAIGFYCTRVSPGGIKRGRSINHYRTDLAATLFVLPGIAPSDQPIDLREYQRMKAAGVAMPSRFSRKHYGSAP